MLKYITPFKEFSFIQFVATATLTLGFSFYLKARPLNVEKSVPGPKSYPFVGFLFYSLKNWETWPCEITYCCFKYGRTWGGKLPNIGGLPGAYVSLMQGMRFFSRYFFDSSCFAVSIIHHPFIYSLLIHSEQFYIFEPDNFKQVLSDVESYRKGDIWQSVLGEILGKGIFTSGNLLYLFFYHVMQS